MPSCFISELLQGKPWIQQSIIRTPLNTHRFAVYPSSIRGSLWHVRLLDNVPTSMTEHWSWKCLGSPQHQHACLGFTPAPVAPWVPTHVGRERIRRRGRRDWEMRGLNQRFRRERGQEKEGEVRGCRLNQYVTFWSSRNWISGSNIPDWLHWTHSDVPTDNHTTNRSSTWSMMSLMSCPSISSHLWQASQSFWTNTTNQQLSPCVRACNHWCCYSGIWATSWIIFYLENAVQPAGLLVIVGGAVKSPLWLR